MMMIRQASSPFWVIAWVGGWRALPTVQTKTKVNRVKEREKEDEHDLCTALEAADRFLFHFSYDFFSTQTK